MISLLNIHLNTFPTYPIRKKCSLFINSIYGRTHPLILFRNMKYSLIFTYVLSTRESTYRCYVTQASHILSLFLAFNATAMNQSLRPDILSFEAPKRGRILSHLDNLLMENLFYIHSLRIPQSCPNVILATHSQAIYMWITLAVNFTRVSTYRTIVAIGGMRVGWWHIVGDIHICTLRYLLNGPLARYCHSCS